MNPRSAGAADTGSPPTEPVAWARSAGHPLGPLVRMVPLDRPVISRLYAAGTLLAVVTLFATAAKLHPDGHDMGTHQQLGLPPCSFAVTTGLPCPTCGMTTAFAYTVRGQLVNAARAQLAGLMLALISLAIGLAGAVATITGRRPELNWYRISPTGVVWVGSGLFVGAWALKLVQHLLHGG